MEDATSGAPEGGVPRKGTRHLLRGARPRRSAISALRSLKGADDPEPCSGPETSEAEHPRIVARRRERMSGNRNGETKCPGTPCSKPAERRSCHRRGAARLWT